MKVSFRDLMDKLGVPNEMTPYETQPFTVYDSEKGVTCSAELRMDADELQGEIQMMYDAPPANGGAMMQQILWFVAQPATGKAEWDVKDARVKKAAIDRTLYNWEEKSCNFYNAVTRFLKMDEIPDMEDLIREEFHSRERMGGSGGAGGGKSPKIKPGQLLNMKKGAGF